MEWIIAVWALGAFVVLAFNYGANKK